MFNIDNKTATIQFRTTEREKELVKQIARQRGLTISDFLKVCIQREVEGMFTRDELLLIEEMTECEIATRREKKELDFYSKDKEDLFSILQKVSEELKK